MQLLTIIGRGELEEYRSHHWLIILQLGDSFQLLQSSSIKTRYDEQMANADLFCAASLVSMPMEM